MQPKELLWAMFRAAVDAASPNQCVPPHLPDPPKGRTIVVGAGKAAAAMARAVEDHWSGPLSGLVITRYGHAAPTRFIETVEAGHPVPDAAGEAATRRILQLAGELGPDDLLLCLISGGGSALLSLPAPGLSIADKQVVSKALLRSGASIREMNCVRKQLSAIKGGRLAAATRAQVVSLIISDVPGDDPSVIASGPTVPDRTTSADALAILRKYAIEPPAAVVRYLSETRIVGEASGRMREDVRTIMIATPQMALERAAETARSAGFTPLILGNAIEGEASQTALVHAGIARQVMEHGQPVAGPCVLLSGGETTVTVRGHGRGGRNAEFLLALAVAFDGVPDVYALAADTDGIDGTEDNAGALLAPDTLKRAAALGVDAKARLADNDGYGFFQALGDLVVTGPTLTNVNDFRAILIDGREPQCKGQG
ncbi:glycerate kinase [Azospirillum sp. CT11-132]|uniref:glycerate kinase type-2 family protein n=1 Tax=unclassified Azospirillum TaxID=2630922 RepID=UPI000D606146|nr:MULTISPECIES: glycerate kinase [unclassified Azospirillum]PWC53132.1 hydroxypyruvate reductase [Azospirillum sp. TSH7]PWC55067.1 hydroxypyruvate reductase [Azospirillum sp. TSH20]